MHQIQMLLPLLNKDGESFTSDIYLELRKELTEKFGGITAYTRSPATGLWKENDNKTIKDKIVIYEVMVDSFELNWWKLFKERLEKIFQQDEILIRAWEVLVI